MTQDCFRRLSRIAACAVVALCCSAPAAWAQVNVNMPPEAQALTAAAVKANPELVKGLAKELKSTPEQAAGAAGLIFGIAKSLLKPDDFAAMSKAVPGMDALLAAAPAGLAPTSGEQTPRLSALTPGIASSPSSSTTMNLGPQDGMASAFTGLSMLGIKPEMIAKAIPFLSGFLKKYGGAALGPLLSSVFKTGK